jgi:arylsulfatase A-like enzyme
MYATIASLAGVPLSNNSAGNSYSIVPLLSNDKAATGRQYAFSEVCANTGAGRKQFAIRDQRYKVLYNGTQWEMFDLTSDPWEKTNIYDKAESAKDRARLLGELRSLRMKATTNGCFVDIPTP